VLVLVEDGDIVETTRGTFEGRVAFTPRGSGGFGYDPIFEPLTEPVGGRTVGQLSAEEKNQVSHRAQAARLMRELLIARGY
jgi:XTP/dITP diphosphohydrolase